MSNQKKVVVIGGGNGTSTVLEALKNLAGELTAIVSMADDGGSTGRLRSQQGSSAVGDIRQCLVGLSGNKAAANIFNYRFNEGDLKGHSFGNIFLTSVEKQTGDLYKAIEMAKDSLEVEANILPMTDDKPYLEVNSGADIIRGVYNAAQKKLTGKNAEFSLKPKSAIASLAKEKILEADLVIVAPGNFYCSIIPALIVDGVYEALTKANAKKIFMVNLVNFKNHCQDYTLNDYIDELDRIVGNKAFDTFVANSRIDQNSPEQFVEPKFQDPINVVVADLLSDDKPRTNPNDKIAMYEQK